eukprot:TRINITY_DN6311_c0_g1_i2.p1 TRINITY_DN6311_c0_g1~~TRINITY_DN6311_c0_g1_i2.p1  ORF type:complete len:297 (+),score=49.11 TRINITY_DN6311_c0_g1_i2:33-893(+)
MGNFLRKQEEHKHSRLVNFSDHLEDPNDLINDPLINDENEDAPKQMVFEDYQQIEQMQIILKKMQLNLQEMANKFKGKNTKKIKKKNEQKRKIPQWITNNLLLITSIWQLLIILIYRIAFHNQGINDSTNEGKFFIIVLAIMIFFQVLQLTFIILTSIKLSKQIIHGTASNWFLIQSYLSTVLLFAGLYELIYILVPDAIVGVIPAMDQNNELTHDFLFIRLIYFSLSVMSTTGFGDIHSNRWYADLIVIVQMLLSVLYTTVIFVRGIEHITQSHASYQISHSDKN